MSLWQVLDASFCQVPDLNEDLDSHSVEFEFRLQCDGELFYAAAADVDWRKFHMSRLLLVRPFELFVVTWPTPDLPQELCIRFRSRFVYEKQAGGGSSGSIPFDERQVADDLCALLTMLSRRRIFQLTQVAVRYGGASTHRNDSFDRNYPTTIFPACDLRERPVRVLRTYEGDNGWTYTPHVPPPVRVDRLGLERLFSRLLACPARVEILQSARLYLGALKLLIAQPDVAYHLLIAAAETLSSVACCDYKPELDKMRESAGGVVKVGRKLGLDSDQLDKLVRAACASHSWIKQKFVKFFIEWTPPSVFGGDSVFPMDSRYEPLLINFERILGVVYDSRSRNLHSGIPFPEVVGAGSFTREDGIELRDDMSRSIEMPPVTWFERVFSAAARDWIKKHIECSSCGFVQSENSEKSS